MTTSCTLVIDTREKNVTRHDIELTDITRVIKQITIGDYAIISPAGQVLVTIERKSLEDFAASLKDGRHSNKAKLIDLRTSTGCRVVYIIEGPEFPHPGTLFGGIPYHHIESSIFHMMVRDCISVIRTADTLSTARTLARFVKSMDTLYVKYGAIDTATSTSTDCTTNSATIDSLARKHIKSDYDIVRELWSCFPGISMESADDYMKHWSIADIISKRVPISSIAAIKMSNGRTINKKVVKALTNIDTTTEVRLIAKIPGISRVSATSLVNNEQLSILLLFTESLLADRCINKVNGRRLGNKLAKDILKYFNYKYIPIVPQYNTSVDPVTINTPKVTTQMPSDDLDLALDVDIDSLLELL